jgi:hypothetical protein
MIKVVLYILLLVAILTSCTKDPIDNPEVFTGKEYFPLKSNNYLIYKITQITIDKPSDLYDTSIYYIKEVVDVQFIDNEGDSAFRIERYRSENLDNNWIINSVWASKLSGNTAEKVEENERIVKLRFPVTEDLSWNGNLLNDLEEQEFWISSINQDYNLNTFVFDSCLTVFQDSSSSLIHKDLAYEIYAYRTGLVYKEMTYLNSQEVIYGVPIENRITTGTIYIQELVEIGQNDN